VLPHPRRPRGNPFNSPSPCPCSSRYNHGLYPRSLYSEKSVASREVSSVQAHRNVLPKETTGKAEDGLARLIIWSTGSVHTRHVLTPICVNLSIKQRAKLYDAGNELLRDPNGRAGFVSSDSTSRSSATSGRKRSVCKRYGLLVAVVIPYIQGWHTRLVALQAGSGLSACSMQRSRTCDSDDGQD
jgi:hypothetical protein